MNKHLEAYKSLPGVDKLLAHQSLQHDLAVYGREVLTYAIRITLDNYRHQLKNGAQAPDEVQLLQQIAENIKSIAEPSLRKVINATGVIIHTNLGRSPFSKAMLDDAFAVLQGYNNLEYDLKSASRGSRNVHAARLLKYLTGAEDVLVVNNAAAAVMLVLRAFAKNREVLVSRGELIEIGGSFRIPDIMAASDCVMVEVGTTNKTRLDDYEKQISPDTGLLFKAHKSNYTISGFTEEVGPEALARLGKKHGIPVLYDLGSGLLRKVNHPALAGEPDVKQALATGVDLVCFSGDKLLGGPQAGIIAGKKKLIALLKKEPMTRALRVCKTTLALLETACKYYLNDEDLMKKNMLFSMFAKKPQQLHDTAEQLKSALLQKGVGCAVVPSKAWCGGGTLPDVHIDSYAVRIDFDGSRKQAVSLAERLFKDLQQGEHAVLGVLRQGRLYFDVLTISPEEYGILVAEIAAKARKMTINKKEI